MKKSELREGVAYAVGGAGRWERGTGKRGVVVALDAERVVARQWSEEGMKRRGIVVSFEGEVPSFLPRAHRVLGASNEVLLDAATAILEEWESYRARRDADAAYTARVKAEREARLARLVAIRDRCGELGVEARVVDYERRQRIEFDVDSIEMLFEVLAKVSA